MAVSDWKIDDGGGVCIGGGFSSPIVVAVLDRLSSSAVNVAQLNPQKNIPFFYPTFSLLNGTAGGRGWVPLEDGFGFHALR